ncbi:MAG TPA: HlyD family efflux transporter periplasmic adaptor subunit [bacterium]|nr:HlyD family efflux transporter periplasmic adaptor subunit [bacterium]
MDKRKWIIIAGFLGILSFSFILMRYLFTLKPELPTRPPPVSERWVMAEPIRYSEILSPITGKGRVHSTAEVEVIAEASGRIEPGDQPLKKGQTFQKGQALLTIYRDEAELALKAQKSQFLNRVAVLLPDIQVDYPEYYGTFLEFFGAIRLDAPLPGLPEVDREPLRIFLASRNFLSDYFAVQQSELRLSRHTIRAPFQGVYTDVFLETGAYANTGSRIARIIATDALEVEVPIETANARWIRIGDPVVLVSEAREIEWRGPVTRVSHFVEDATQSRSVFVRVPLTGQNPLFSGEFLLARFEGTPVKDVMQIPRNALFNYNQVFLVLDGLLQIRTVDVVRLTENTALIKGPEPEMYVVTQPLINVSENSPVKIRGVDSPAHGLKQSDG